MASPGLMIDRSGSVTTVPLVPVIVMLMMLVSRFSREASILNVEPSDTWTRLG